MKDYDGKLKASGLRYRVLSDNGSTVEIVTETGVRTNISKADLNGASKTPLSTTSAPAQAAPSGSRLLRPSAAQCAKHNRPYCHDCIGKTLNPIGNQTSGGSGDGAICWGFGANALMYGKADRPI